MPQCNLLSKYLLPKGTDSEKEMPEYFLVREVKLETKYYVYFSK